MRIIGNITMSDNKRRLSTLWLSAEEQADLAILAAKLGYYQTRGAGAGKLGSISAMLRGIQQGELIILKRELNDEKQ